MTDTSTPPSREFQACIAEWSHCKLRDRKAAEEMRERCIVALEREDGFTVDERRIAIAAIRALEVDDG